MPRRVLHDEFFQRAKRDGYAARSAYKLLELNEKRRLIRKGDRVLDVGCAPGSWLQVACRLVGPKGTVVGIDLKPVEPAIAGSARTTVGDVTEIDPEELLALAGGRFHAVVSDMAPDTIGAGDDDRSAELCRMLLGILPALLRPRGHFTMKVLEGAQHPQLLSETRALFEEVKGLKPKACRDVSREIYIVGKGFRAPAQDHGS